VRWVCSASARSTLLLLLLVVVAPAVEAPGAVKGMPGKLPPADAAAADPGPGPAVDGN
jgi:hypothetical protein